MKRTEAAVVASGFFQQDILGDQFYDIRCVFDLFDFVFGNEIRQSITFGESIAYLPIRGKAQKVTAVRPGV